MAILTNAMTIAVLAAGILYTAFKLYGRFLSEKVFGFDDTRPTPAVEKNDGVDFVPTRKSVLFGHHFASIAGLGPIIGPAIAVYWGWLPAILWVLVGCILIGGVHDLAALYASLRHKARGIGDLTNDIIGPRARLLFLFIIFFLLALAMGVFAIVMAGLFTNLAPEAVLPTFSLIAIAMVIGLLTYKAKFKLGPVTAVGVAAMFAMLFVGLKIPLPLHKAFVSDEATRAAAADAQEAGITSVKAQISHFQANTDTQAVAEHLTQAQASATTTWVFVLLAYALVASVLPVWLLLQPRDYINCFQLYAGLGLLMIGFVVAHPRITADPFNAGIADDPGNPGIMPFLFITIACGAVSGFHNLVASGTTARQIRRESDARTIGYGGMLMEGLLAVFVILACTAGLSSTDFAARFGSFRGLTGATALDAFLTGAGHVVAQPFLAILPASVSAEATQQFFRIFISVMVVSFAMTTLDSATRLLRYNVEELGRSFGVRVVQNRYVASLIAVSAIACFALMKINGKQAGLTLWQLFGTTNQLLAVLGLLVATVLLYKLGKPIVYTLVPMLVMMVGVSWAIGLKLRDFYQGYRATGDAGSLALLIVGATLAVMAAWMVVEAAGAFLRHRAAAALETT